MFGGCHPPVHHYHTLSSHCGTLWPPFTSLRPPLSFPSPSCHTVWSHITPQWAPVNPYHSPVPPCVAPYHSPFAPVLPGGPLQHSCGSPLPPCHPFVTPYHTPVGTCGPMYPHSPHVNPDQLLCPPLWPPVVPLRPPVAPCGPQSSPHCPLLVTWNLAGDDAVQVTLTLLQQDNSNISETPGTR